jgi:hypothetical protein
VKLSPHLILFLLIASFALTAHGLGPESTCQSVHKKYGYSTSNRCLETNRPINQIGIPQIKKQINTFTPGKKIIRIVLLGGLVMNFKSGPMTTVLDKVSKSLRDKGIVAEVFLGSFPYFHIVSNIDLGLDMISQYSPDFVFYVQDNAFAPRDFVEDFYARFTPDGRFDRSENICQKFHSPKWLEWIWPSDQSQCDWSHEWNEFVAAKSLRKNGHSATQAAELFIAPITRSLQKLKAGLDKKTKLAVIMPRRDASTRFWIGFQSPLLESYLQPLVPNIQVGAKSVEETLTRSGFLVTPTDTENQSVADAIVGEVLSKTAQKD